VPSYAFEFLAPASRAKRGLWAGSPQLILPENIVLMPLSSYATVLRIGTRVLMVLLLGHLP
jgi:hypothetical protein